ncbi:hypothetical protein P7K49_023347 [Saguinus oedipus]|uniref:Uncharacterized protein n=1 Tax=Saguinus oedipus TaxID=9490 RepID=A0ABQ9UM26_SAGOE|nr:hypothetical protein P7K49_023347 [Saguinus oedipus]
MISLIAIAFGSSTPRAEQRPWAQRAAGSPCESFIEAELGLAPEPVHSGVGSGAGDGAMAMAGAACFLVVPSRGLAAMSAFRPRLGAQGFSGAAAAGPQRTGEGDAGHGDLGAVLAVAGKLAEARAAAGEEIGPPRKRRWPGAAVRGWEKRRILHHRHTATCAP